MIEADLIRFFEQEDKDVETLGNLHVYENAKRILSFLTLELPDRDNKFRVSSIPEGIYRVVPRYSAKFGHHFHVTDVEGRSLILIHAGNYFKDTLGCILIGKEFGDINGDGVADVLSSRASLQELLKIVPNGFELTITQQQC